MPTSSAAKIQKQSLVCIYNPFLNCLLERKSSARCPRQCVKLNSLTPPPPVSSLFFLRKLYAQCGAGTHDPKIMLYQLTQPGATWFFCLFLIRELHYYPLSGPMKEHDHPSPFTSLIPTLLMNPTDPCQLCSFSFLSRHR